MMSMTGRLSPAATCACIGMTTTRLCADHARRGSRRLRRNKEQAGLVTDSPIDLYVYPNYEDMKDAILYEPSWTAAWLFSEFNVFIMGVSGSDATWDKNTVIHELTHILVGHLTFSCLGDVPTWLNEGLAMYSEANWILARKPNWIRQSALTPCSPSAR